MKKVLRKNNFVAGILILVVVCLGIVLAGDVIVKEGVLEGEKFQSTGCNTEDGTKAVAFGYDTEASGNWSTAIGYETTAEGNGSIAMGYQTTAIGHLSTAMGNETTASGGSSTAMGYVTDANGDYSTAMGYYTTASGLCSTAMGTSTTAGPANYTTAIGRNFTNNVQDSFAVGYGAVDFRVVKPITQEPKVYIYNGHLWVDGLVFCEDVVTGSSFYDKDVYGTALDYLEDSSKTVKVNPEGEKEYNHEEDPAFLQKQVTVKDYDKYTEEEVWNDLLEQTITSRIYETHQELRSNLSMKVAWLRQCVFELKQENQTLKDEIAQIKDAVGIE